MVLSKSRVKVEAHFREWGSVLGGTAEGRCEDFDIELSVESDEPQEKVSELIRLAHQMCFTEDVVMNKVEVKTRHLLNGRELD
jgi:organic hydroperoxide reductase OsmC/OhrA